MAFSKGLAFKKFDLQVHTPGSKCFYDTHVTADQIVAEALKKGLSGIAITDHNTGDWIDKVKEAAKGTPLVVFPGVEIHVPSGQRGIHVLALLDVDKGTKQVTELCGALKIKEVNGELISELGLTDVINTVSNNIHSGLVILAHCTGPKGAISEMAGLQVSSVFENPNLLAVDVATDDFTDADKIAKRQRVVDLLDGTNTKFCYRLADGKFELLKNLSIGQKCTAMLIMTLSDGSLPVVIDQPEDSLDIRSIWEDMCAKLRTGKEGRQFIFTTHNSSLAVASDTDKYTVLESGAVHGKVVFSGAIDTEEVRQQVIEYLEGGIPTYRSKYLKYNIPREKLFS